MTSQVLSLCVVLAGAAVLPLGLRAVNGLLPGAGASNSYLPTLETPRPRAPFDETAATAIREAQPEFVVIGDSMAGVRIDPKILSKASGRSVASIVTPGTPVAYWYLQLKNQIAGNQLKTIRGAILFFRDDQLTTQVEVNGPILDPVARDQEPELDRVLAAHRLGTFSDVHRVARSAYQFDRTRVWLEERVTHAPSTFALRATADKAMTSQGLLDAINTEIFGLDKLRKFEAADLPQAEDAFLDFDAEINRSLLPEMVRVAEQAGIKLAFIRVQRRPKPDGPPDQRQALTQYLEKLEAWLEARGAYYHDDRGDPDQPLAVYSDGDHLRFDARPAYTERFARKHAAFFQ